MRTRRHRSKKLCKTLNKRRQAVGRSVKKLCRLKRNKSRCQRVSKIVRLAKKVPGPKLCKTGILPHKKQLKKSRRLKKGSRKMRGGRQ